MPLSGGMENLYTRMNTSWHASATAGRLSSLMDSMVTFESCRRSNFLKESVMKKILLIGLIAALALITPHAQAQDSSERVVVNFSDPSRPGLLRVSMINGGISVRSHNGREVIVETRASTRGRRSPVRSDGLRRIDNGALGLSIEEENNVMVVGTRNPNDFGGLVIQVPARTNLSLKTVNGGNIEVEDVEGEIEVNNTNGSVLLNNVAGSIVAHATNGKVTATVREVSP